MVSRGSNGSTDSPRPFRQRSISIVKTGWPSAPSRPAATNCKALPFVELPKTSVTESLPGLYAAASRETTLVFFFVILWVTR